MYAFHTFFEKRLRSTPTVGLGSEMDLLACVQRLKMISLRSSFISKVVFWCSLWKEVNITVPSPALKRTASGASGIVLSRLLLQSYIFTDALIKVSASECMPDAITHDAKSKFMFALSLPSTVCMFSSMTVASTKPSEPTRAVSKLCVKLGPQCRQIPFFLLRPSIRKRG